MEITNTYREKVLGALLEARQNFSGSDAQFAARFAINKSVFSTLKSGKYDRLLSDDRWIEVGMQLGVSTRERKWTMVRTEVFNMIEQTVLFCKEYSKGKIIVDDAAVGKTFSARYLSTRVENCFYIDGSQCKSQRAFTKALARTVGMTPQGHTYEEIKDRIKYTLKVLDRPIVIIDEAGDLDYRAFLDIKEYWNATENLCGWLLLGADGLRAKIDQGIGRAKVGYKEIFSRMAERYTPIVPAVAEERKLFYKNLITDIVSANIRNRDRLARIINKCLAFDRGEGEATGLRRVEGVLILEDK